MSKREKIIVALASLALIYALYVVVLSPHPKRIPGVSESHSNQLSKFVTEVVQSLSEETPSKKDVYIMKRMLAPWRQDLFRDPYVSKSEGVEEEIPEAEPPPRDMDLVYSGYLEMGSKRIAIISGREYQVGDGLKPEGLIVRAIHPDRIILEIKDQERKITLPLKEEPL